MAKDFKAAIKAGSIAGRLAKSPLLEELEQQTAQVPVVEVPIAMLRDNPYQQLARPEMDETALEELADSIRLNGFYGALLARIAPDHSGDYELAYGHRRRDAAQRAGLQALPLKVIALTNEQLARIMASENFSRQDLTPLGEANVLGMLEVNQNLSAREIARIVGRDRGWVERRMALYHAPAEVKEMVAQKPDSFSLVDLLTQQEAERRPQLIEQVIKENLSRRQLQQLLEPDLIVNPVTTSTLSGANTKNHKDSQKSKTEIVNPVTTSTLSGDSEIDNDVLETCREFLGLLDKAVGGLEEVVAGKTLPPAERQQLIALAHRLGNIGG
jgi:ParB family chromosome partitioning protein